MTKSQEIETLKTFVATLPKDSYIRPWLENVLPEVESEIRSDFLVSPSLKATREQCDAMLADKQAQCKTMIEYAREQAKQLRQAACDESERVRDRLAGDLRAALRSMGN